MMPPQPPAGAPQQQPPAPPADEPDGFEPAPSSSATTGELVTYQLDEDGPAVRGLVVGEIAGDEDRDDALLVVPLPDAVTVPVDAVLDSED